MSPKFGTSGLRGLVTALTPELVGDYVRAFVTACPVGTGLYIGHDLRPSSPDLAEDVARAAQAAGVDVTVCGAVPTPALALAAMQAGAGAVMVTGSHIPADRNGLKFYTPTGEITKADEAAILAAREAAVAGAAPATPGGRALRDDVGALYTERYRGAYAGALAGLRLGFYAQSAVGRDLMMTLLRDLGAAVTELGRSETFVPVDTEAVPADVRRQLADWAAGGDFDAILSTDADGDRPLLADGVGQVIPGDVLGQITGRALAATTAVTPVSSNTGAETVFAQVLRTKIGSPYVIAAMDQAAGAVVGYEANGGFLLGFDAMGPSGPLPALMTRDAVLPLLAVLAAAREPGLAALLAAQPQRFTASDRLPDIPTQISQALIADMRENPRHRADFCTGLGLADPALDLTDGLRLTAAGGQVVHLRPSGNAPELRVYTEAESAPEARTLCRSTCAQLAARISAPAPLCNSCS